MKISKLALIALLGLGSLKLSSQDFQYPKETDPYKFVPKNAVKLEFHVNTRTFGPLVGVWYNPQYKYVEDYLAAESEYEEKNEEIPREELYVDIDRDGILDVSISELQALYSKYLKMKEKIKTGA
jgi:hypothetical protein